MEFPTVINWRSPFPILGLLGGIFHFYSNFKRNFCKRTVENLHCLPMSHKKDDRLIWVKLPFVIKIFVLSSFKWPF